MKNCYEHPKINRRHPSAGCAIAGILAISYLLFFIFGRANTAILSPDSLEYIDFAKQLTSAGIFEARTTIPAEQLYPRVPIYPLILISGHFLTGSYESGAIAMHFLIGLASLLFVVWSLRERVPLFLSGSSILLAQFSMGQYYNRILSEWSSFNGLLVLFVLTFKFSQSRTRRDLFLLGICCSYLVLLRPAFQFVIFLPALAALYVGGRNLRWFLTALGSLTPILLWMLLNVFRIDCFCIARSGPNLFCTTAMIGDAVASPEDSPAVREFIAVVNAQKIPVTGAEGQKLNDRSIDERLRAYDHVFHDVVLSYKAEHQRSDVEMQTLMRAYASKVIKDRPIEYVRFVGANLESYLGELLLVLPMILLLYIWYRRSYEIELSAALGVLIVCYIIHACVVSALIIAIPRYHSVTFYPLLAGAMLCIGLSILKIFQSRP